MSVKLFKRTWKSPASVGKSSTIPFTAACASAFACCASTSAELRLSNYACVTLSPSASEALAPLLDTPPLPLQPGLLPPQVHLHMEYRCRWYHSSLGS